MGSRGSLFIGRAIQKELLYNPRSTAKEDFTMSLTYQQVAHAAMQLSPNERVDLAKKLLVSVDTPETIAAAWDEEIARRIAQLDAGEAETVPAEQVFAELRARLK
jgi:putative addiction module component (TIGR02574 family)